MTLCACSCAILVCPCKSVLDNFSASPSAFYLCLPVCTMAERIFKSGKQDKMTQRVVIKFFAAHDMRPIDIWWRLRRVHGVHTLCQASVRNWVRKFCEDPTLSCLDKPRSGCPRFMCCPRHIQQVERLIHEDSHRSVRELSSITGVSIGSVHQIITKELHMRKVAVRFVPKLLNDDQCCQRLEVCRRNLQWVAMEPTLLRNIVTGDESWVHCYDPNTKHKAQAWVRRQDDHPIQALRSRSVKKVMLCAFFDDTGVVHFEFCNRTINRFTYTKIMGRLREKIQKEARTLDVVAVIA